MTKLFSIFLLCGALVVPAWAADSGGRPAAGSACSGAVQGGFSTAAMARQVKAFQVLSEEALSLRAQGVAFLADLKAADARGEPLYGGALRRLNRGAADLLEQRRALLAMASRHECWLDLPLPADEEAARVQATGIAMSLAAALILYDNYLTAVGLYRATPSLRQHLNRKDSGFAIPAGELTRISASFSSAVNRARVRRGLLWHERHGGRLADSGNADERYIAALIAQSPSYNMVRQVRPVGYAENLMGFFGVLSIDTINQLKNEGINFYSMLFGNAVGLVESRRGKLDAQPQVIEKVVAAVQAGDILLEKTPFRLTDAFIPGHWGHAAIWVGSETELRELGIWDHPVVRRHQARIREGRGVVEALRGGVKMNTLTQFVNVDDLAVLRQRSASPAERIEVVLQALRQVGKAYDFNFDVESTDRIVCSELVYHAYGDIRWPTARHLGRATVSPDNIAVLATGDGPFAVALLYHDGREIGDEPNRYLERLVEREVVKLARGG